jgi:hypothetical protein
MNVEKHPDEFSERPDLQDKELNIRKNANKNAKSFGL